MSTTSAKAIVWLIVQAESATARQRHKGLGEMNPQQLWGNDDGPRSAAAA